MFPLFNRKKHNEEQDVPRKEERKSTLDDFQTSGDLSVLDKDDMSKLEGGQTGTRTFTDMLGWTSSLGDTIPQ